MITDKTLVHGTHKDPVDVIVNLECIHLYLLSIVTQCLFWDFLVSCHAPMFRSGESIM